MSTVLIAKVNNNISEIIDQIFAEFKVNVAGKKVLIKPNIVAPFPPERGITTNPQVVAAIVDKCLAQGANVMVGDNPGGVESNSYYTAQKAGIIEASHGCFMKLSEQVVEIPIKSRYTETIPISKIILEIDYLINVPVFKTHSFTTITGAIKNLFGYVAGAGKARLHLKAPSRRRFAELLNDIYQLRPPDLNILDGTQAMEGNGPTHGQLRPLGKILASTDAAALDATMSRMIGVEPGQIYMLAEAERRGWGKIKAEEINIIGELEVIPDFVLPHSFRTSSKEQVSALEAVTNTRPQLQENKCIQCGDCAQNCPMQAIKLDPYPQIDNDKCIACFCCVELCPEGAWDLSAVQEHFNRIFES